MATRNATYGTSAPSVFTSKGTIAPAPAAVTVAAVTGAAAAAPRVSAVTSIAAAPVAVAKPMTSAPNASPVPTYSPVQTSAPVPTYSPTPVQSSNTPSMPSPMTGGPAQSNPGIAPSDPTPTASQALYNDPNLPPDDSQQWHDPAPVAVASSPATVQTVANPVASTSTALVTTSPTTTAVTTPSLWTRILTWFGFLKAPVASTTTVHGEKGPSIEQAAVSLVRRIRNGDQNAMGLAVMIGDNARKGDPTAQKTYKLMEAYATKTGTAVNGEPSARQPYNMGGEPSARQPYNMGNERVNSGWAKAVHLSNGPILHDRKVADVASSFGEEHNAKAFIAGVIHPTYPAVNSAHHHGKVVGMARKIQAVRMPNSRISDYSPTVGWELGE